MTLPSCEKPYAPDADADISLAVLPSGEIIIKRLPSGYKIPSPDGDHTGICKASPLTSDNNASGELCPVVFTFISARRPSWSSQHTNQPPSGDQPPGDSLR